MQNDEWERIKRMETQMIGFVVQRLINLIGPITEMSRDKRELRDNALRSISHALNETYLYYRGINSGKDRDMDTEAQLSRYWAATAIPLRHIDSELAEICEYKSNYWINPETWDNSKIDELGIGLEDVRERYLKLLRPKRSSTGKLPFSKKSNLK